jgi:probable rRNA maturation factor
MVLVSERADHDAEKISIAALERFMARARRSVGLGGKVTVLLSADSEIRELNRSFRGKNKTTDVLSFPSANGNGYAGDIAISIEAAQRQAREHGHSTAEEIRILMLHGMLHLAGMDHERDNGAMLRKESRLRRELGLKEGLIARVRDKRTRVRKK